MSGLKQNRGYETELFIPHYVELDGHRIVVSSQERADELYKMGYRNIAPVVELADTQG